jgi:phytol kinase
MPAMIVAACLLLSVLAVGEVLHRARGVDAEVTRTGVHVVTACVAAVLPFFVGRWFIVGLGVCFAVAMAASRATGFLGGVHDVSRRTWGEVAFPLGIALPAALGVARPAYVFGVLVLGLGDSAAGVVGRRWGRHQFHSWGGNKSWEGSSSMCAVAIALGLVALRGSDVGLGSVALAVATTAVVCTFAEAELGWGLDNLVLPILGAVTLSMTSGAWNVL